MGQGVTATELHDSTLLGRAFLKKKTTDREAFSEDLKLRGARNADTAGRLGPYDDGRFRRGMPLPLEDHIRINTVPDDQGIAGLRIFQPVGHFGDIQRAVPASGQDPKRCSQQGISHFYHLTPAFSRMAEIASVTSGVSGFTFVTSRVMPFWVPP